MTTYQNDNAHLISLIFKLIIVVVFIGMNILYQLFWKNSAQSDYFESLGITTLPPELPEEKTLAPRQTKPHTCPCGYDLRAHPDAWLHVADQAPPRCPNCEREIFPDELDLSLAVDIPAAQPDPQQIDPPLAQSPPIAPTKPPVEIIGAPI